MGVLDVRFHGICTHYRGVGTAHRVVLLQCDDAHRPLLAVPGGTTIFEEGDPACKCIVKAGSDGTDTLYELHGVHLTMGLRERVTWGTLWACGVPSLTVMDAHLGPAAPEKVELTPPEGVAAWFDVTGGELTPYVSSKGAVAVRLNASFAGDPQLVARCWHCDVQWTFTIPSGKQVRVSNDCGGASDPGDFRMHFRIAQLPPANAPSLLKLPGCLPPAPQGFHQDAPPGWRWGGASLLCSNSQYP